MIAQEETEEDYFCCDESDDYKVESMKGVEKEDEQGKWSQEEKASKRKSVPGKAAANSMMPTKQSQMTVTVYFYDTSATKM
eukprot:6752402-Ditylum_brightwellii.AAC.1